MWTGVKVFTVPPSLGRGTLPLALVMFPECLVSCLPPPGSLFLVKCDWVGERCLLWSRKACYSFGFLCPCSLWSLVTRCRKAEYVLSPGDLGWRQRAQNKVQGMERNEIWSGLTMTLQEKAGHSSSSDSLISLAPSTLISIVKTIGNPWPSCPRPAMWMGYKYLISCSHLSMLGMWVDPGPGWFGFKSHLLLPCCGTSAPSPYPLRSLISLFAK